MNVFDVMMKSNQIRKFKPDSIDDKIIGVILYMATQAYSAGNTQEWQFIVVKDSERKGKLYEAALKQDFIKDAPVDIIVCADLKKISLKYEKRGELLYSLQDTAYATQNILLAAEGLGLGSNLVQSFDEDKISEIIGLPEYIRPVAIIAIGYPAEEVKEKERITFENLTSVEKWGEKFEISYVIQPGAKRDIKPIGNIIEEAIEKQKGKSGKKLIDEILKRLSKIDFKL
jgi:nitroreductase